MNNKRLKFCEIKTKNTKIVEVNDLRPMMVTDQNIKNSTLNSIIFNIKFENLQLHKNVATPKQSFAWSSRNKYYSGETFSKDGYIMRFFKISWGLNLHLVWTHIDANFLFLDPITTLNELGANCFGVGYPNSEPEFGHAKALSHFWHLIRTRPVKAQTTSSLTWPRTWVWDCVTTNH